MGKTNHQRGFKDTSRRYHPDSFPSAGYLCTFSDKLISACGGHGSKRQEMHWKAGVKKFVRTRRRFHERMKMHEIRREYAGVAQ